MREGGRGEEHPRRPIPPRVIHVAALFIVNHGARPQRDAAFV